MPSPAFPQNSVLNKGQGGHGSAPALCQLHPCEHRRERWVGDQRQEQPVLSTGIDPAEVSTRGFFSLHPVSTAPAPHCAKTQFLLCRPESRRVENGATIVAHHCV